MTNDPFKLESLNNLTKANVTTQASSYPFRVRNMILITI